MTRIRKAISGAIDKDAANNYTHTHTHDRIDTRVIEKKTVCVKDVILAPYNASPQRFWHV